MSEFRPYLHNAHIEGYKSIVNCDVTFKPGLNIIIGRNGTGKTNLLEALRMAIIARSYPIYLQHFPEFSSSVNYRDLCGSDTQYVLTADVKGDTDWDYGVVTEDFKVNGAALPEQIKDQRSLRLFVTLFQHGIPKETPLFDHPRAGWSFLKGSKVAQVDEPAPNWRTIGSIQQEVRNAIAALDTKEDLELEEIEDYVAQAMESAISKYLPSIRAYTPIRDVNVRKGQVEPTNLQHKFLVRGFQYQMNIDGAYLPFSNLSDGTKRILLLLLEALANGDNSGIYQKLFLLEEPELGIHPHQLHKLMTFLKEQSENKQIILTTHSPQVLDVLGKDELDRIIIADFDPQKGSTFRHLAQAEIEDAQNFMDGMYLSDYWRFSDLEPEVAR